MNFTTKNNTTRKYTTIEYVEEAYGVQVSKSNEKVFLTLVSDELKSVYNYDVRIELYKSYEISNINIKNIKSIYVAEYGQDVNYPIALFLMEDGTIEWLNIEEALANGEFKAEGKIKNIENIVRITRADVGEYSQSGEALGGSITIIGIREDGNFYDLIDEIMYK